MTDEKHTKADYALHVELLMRKHDMSKADACFVAWSEGPEEFRKFLNPKAEAQKEA